MLTSVRMTLAVFVCALVSAGLLAAQASTSSVEELRALRPLLDATGFTGTVLVYDLQQDRLSAVYAQGVDQRRIPASTFKILNSLVALEIGLVADETTVLEWDGVVNERTELNRNLDLATAFRLSAVPYYQALARRAGQERMQRFVDDVGYGNRDIGGGLDQFWLRGALRISPREQVQLLTRLYRSQLPFSEHAMRTVRTIMEVERTPHTVTRAKTGLAVMADGQRVGWWVGWVERGPNAFVFATVLEHPRESSTFIPARLDVTRAVLRAMKILD